jgi:hypothetical protein
MRLERALLRSEAHPALGRNRIEHGFKLMGPTSPHDGGERNEATIGRIGSVCFINALRMARECALCVTPAL